MKNKYLSLLFLCCSIYAQTGTIDNSYNPSDDGRHLQNYSGGFELSLTTYPVVFSDGKVVVNYSYDATYGLRKLNTDGSIDTTFNFNNQSGPIFTIFPHPDDKFIAVAYSGVIKRYFSDGSLDPSFNPPAAMSIGDIDYLADGKMLITGGFTLTVNNIVYNNFVKLNTDGSIDTTFNTGTGFDDFTTAAEVLSNGKILVSGNFERVNNINRRGLARLNSDGSFDGTFTISNGFVETWVSDIKILSNGKILVAGDDEFFISASYFRPTLIRLNSNGSYDTTFQGPISLYGTQGTSKITMQPDGKILLHTRIGDTQPSNHYRLNADGTEDTTFNSTNTYDGNMGTVVRQPDGKFLIGASYKSATGITRDGIHRINADGSLDYTFNPNSGPNNEIFYNYTLSNSKTIITGNFTSYNDLPANKFARLNADGTLDTGFTIDPAVTSVPSYESTAKQQSDGKVLISSMQLKVNNENATLIRLNDNGSLDNSFLFDGREYFINDFDVQTDDKIIVAGTGTYYQIGDNYTIFRINNDGSIDSTFPTLLFNDRVYSVEVLNDNKILVAGKFTQVNGFVVNRAVRLNADGTVDGTFTLNNLDNTGTGYIDHVTKTLTLPTGKIIVAYYNNNTYRYKFARFNENGSVDSSFFINAGSPYVSGTNSLVPGFRKIYALQDNSILLSAANDTFNGVSQGVMPGLHINENGTWDSAFWGNRNVNTETLSVQGCHKAIVTGSFLTYGNVLKNKIVRLNITNNPDMPAGRSSQTFTQGETLANLVVEGSDMIWYTSPGQCNLVSSTARIMEDVQLPEDTVLENGATYYVSQTVNGLESYDRLAITVTLEVMGTGTNTISKLKLYPNPTHNNITLTGNEVSKVEVYTLYGQLLFSQNFNAQEAVVDMSAYSNGIYIFKALSVDGEQTFKVVKQ